MNFKIFLIIILLNCVSCTDQINNSNILYKLEDNQKIENKFNSYTFLLIPDPEMVKFYKNNPDEFKNLTDAACNLGRSIGKDNLFVIFVNNENLPDFLRSQNIVDIFNKNKRFFQKEINYNKSPIVIFSNYNPELNDSTSVKYHSGIQFNTNDTKVVINYLTELSRLIRNDKIFPGLLESDEGINEFHQLLKRLNLTLNLKDKSITISF
nr:hypothetical protein [uncultured Desulfobulbus sp.]